MRKLWLLATLLVIALGACAVPTSESSVEPSAAEVQQARDYLATKGKDDGGFHSEEGWHHGIVLRTFYESGNWSMIVLTPEGKRETIEAMGNNNSALHKKVLTGDYIAYKLLTADDSDVGTQEVEILESVVVDIKGK